jgi:ribosomal protein L7/L12
MKASGEDREAILTFLRSKRCSKIDSIRVIMAVLDVDLARAKRIVHQSRAWADMRDRDDSFHGALERAARRRPARAK